MCWSVAELRSSRTPTVNIFNFTVELYFTGELTQAKNSRYRWYATTVLPPMWEYGCDNRTCIEDHNIQGLRRGSGGCGQRVKEVTGLYSVLSVLYDLVVVFSKYRVNTVIL